MQDMLLQLYDTYYLFYGQIIVLKQLTYGLFLVKPGENLPPVQLLRFFYIQCSYCMLLFDGYIIQNSHYSQALHCPTETND